MPIPYRARIVEFCRRHRIVVPPNFDAPKSTQKFVLVDLSSNPPTLAPRSTCFEKQLLAWGREFAVLGKKVRYLDFKRQCEMIIDADGRLVRGEPISARSAEEERHIKWNERNEA
jgi:hypothetical protein